MKEKSQYLSKLQKTILQIFTLTFVSLAIVIIFLYKYYDIKIHREKEQILQANYSKLLDISLSVINPLVAKVLTDIQAKDIAISTANHNIEICQYDKCLGYNLFKFGALLDKSIPKSINYKIELNDNLLYASAKVGDYELERKYYINNYLQLKISLVVDKIFWQFKEQNLREPFWFVSFFILASFGLLYFIYRILFKALNRSYEAHYQNVHIAELEKIKTEHQNTWKNYETSLLQKIWNTDFNKQKDIAINCLFAQEANKIAYLEANGNYSQDSVGEYGLKTACNNVPCSIVLYREQTTKEEINVDKLVDIFTSRFDQEAENIKFVASSGVKIIYFTSKAALYQIIYSLTLYLFFLLNKQSPNTQHQINLFIDNVGDRLKLCFSYDGLVINKEEELFVASNNFFKTHANPFLLDIKQVFSVLRASGFDYKLSCDQLNVIEIFEMQMESDQFKNIDSNIISLSFFKQSRK